jgi:hypothetical protein
MRRAPAVRGLAAYQPERRGADQLELGDRRFADAGNLAQQLFRRVHRLGEGAEAGNERLGQRLGIAPRRGAEQDQLEQLVVGEGVWPRLAEALPEPLAMTEIMWPGRILEAHSAFAHWRW